MRKSLPVQPETNTENTRRKYLLKYLLWGALCVLSIALLWGASKYLQRPTAPAPPTIVASGVDPQVARAIEQARAQVLAAPASGALWGKLGTMFYVHNFQPQAVQSFAQAMRLEAKDARWPYLRALSQLQQAPDAALALPDLQRAAQLAGDEPAAPRLTLAETLLDLGRAEEAAPLLQQALKHDANDARALLDSGRLAVARGQNDRAKKFLLQSYKNAPEVKATQLLLSQVLQRLGDKKQAAQFAARAQSLPTGASWPDPYAEEALSFQVGKVAQIRRGEVAIINGQFPAAIVQMQQTVQDYPDAGRAWMLLGVAYARTGNLAPGESALRRALVLDNAAETLNHLGDTLARQNRNGEAVTYFQQALQKSPQSAEFHFNLGVCWFRLNKLPQALQELNSAVRLNPDVMRFRAGLAEALARSGKREAAIKEFQAALRLEPNNAQLKQNLQQLQQAK